MEPSQDPLQELIAIEKQNQALLQELLINQTMMLESDKERRKGEKRKIWIQIVKYIFWGVVIIWSFLFTQKLTQGLIGGMTGTGALPSGTNISDILQGALGGGMDPDVQKELGNP